jgi:Dcp1-like decapping family
VSVAFINDNYYIPYGSSDKVCVSSILLCLYAAKIKCVSCSHMVFHCINYYSSTCYAFFSFRSAFPIYGFMIINRLGLRDLIQPINQKLEFQLQDPFLLYRTEKG